MDIWYNLPLAVHCEFEGYIGWKKSLNILGHSPEKLKYVPLKLAQVEMFSFGKSTYTANAKDSEVIKKVHGFWVIQLKNWNMSY